VGPLFLGLLLPKYLSHEPVGGDLVWHSGAWSIPETFDQAHGIFYVVGRVGAFVVGYDLLGAPHVVVVGLSEACVDVAADRTFECALGLAARWGMDARPFGSPALGEFMVMCFLSWAFQLFVFVIPAKRGSVSTFSKPFSLLFGREAALGNFRRVGSGFTVTAFISGCGEPLDRARNLSHALRERLSVHRFSPTFAIVPVDVGRAAVVFAALRARFAAGAY
jgi:hypothetical protein